MNPMHRCFVAAALAACALLPAATQAQGFGQNQVAYQKFEWRVMETEHFLIHYYPEITEATTQGARMAERQYARLSRLLKHQFREKKPLIFFASRMGFGQNNITGDLGEGTGGVTDALRQRAQIPFTGDMKSFEHVLGHEMVHVFQYDIFARGQAGAGLQALAQVNPPLWFIEGMAEYLTTGPNSPHTRLVMRDAAINGHLPTIQQLADSREFFPYTYGLSLWAYIGARWGDEVIGDIMNGLPSRGVERAFRAELGVTLDELGDEWKESLQAQLLPALAAQDRPRKFAQAMLNVRKTGGNLFIAPSLSDDGNMIAFVSVGSFLRGEVFPDLWLADARSGKRLKRLIKTTTNSDFEELRLLYSQSAFSPDGRTLAFTAQKDGKDVLYMVDVKSQNIVRTFDHLPVEQALNPTWSPDGRRLVFSGNEGGITDLYMVDRDGRNVRRLTHDIYGDLMPQWSPDGRQIAFVSDRGPGTNLQLLKFAPLSITILDLESGAITTLPGQAGLNINPMWAPDGRSIAYISDRAGSANVFLYDIATKEHYQLTNLVGGTSAITEFSPALTWARGADKLAFVYYESGDYTVWSVSNPRQLKKQPYRDGSAPAATVIAAAGGALAPTPGTPATGAGPVTDFPSAVTPGEGAVTRPQPTTGTPTPPTAAGPNTPPMSTTPRGAAATPQVDPATKRGSFYRSPGGVRNSADLPNENKGRSGDAVSVVALLDSANLALPDASTFRTYPYRTSLQAEYVAQPVIGYSPDNYGRGVFGGTTIVFSDLLGNSRLLFSGAINGRLQEANFFGAYQNLASRWQWAVGLSQSPLFYYAGSSTKNNGDGTYTESQTIFRRIDRSVFGQISYPLNRFTRWDFGFAYTNVDQAAITYQRDIDGINGFASALREGQVTNGSVFSLVAPSVAYVFDNALVGYNGPLSGRRTRIALSPVFGGLSFWEGSIDYRRYDPILFGFLTFATRFNAVIRKGADEARFPMYIGRPWSVRGYDRENAFSSGCIPELGGQLASCSSSKLIGSRVALFNAELRFPIVRRLDLGILPISLPPVDGLFFFDSGIAWNPGQKIALSEPDNNTNDLTRSPLSSYGFGIRFNLFNIAPLRWDYAIPMADPQRRGYWVFSLGQSF